MLHTFKLYGQYYGIDTASGAIHALSEMKRDILRYAKLPFEDSFPSSLRYDLAKYESAQLSSAYLELRALWLDGVLLSGEPATELSPVKEENKPATVTVKWSSVKPVFATEVIRHAENGAEVIDLECEDIEAVKVQDYDIVFSELERIAKEIIKRKTGRIPFPVFTFKPFEPSLLTDGKGHLHIPLTDAALFEGAESIGRKMTECAVAVYLS